MRRKTTSQWNQRRERTDRLRAISDRAWGEMDQRTRQRTIMLVAAFAADEGGEPGLADYLLSAAPDRARHVATMVAVHALLRGVATVWDVLMSGDAADIETAILFYEADATFIWLPEPGDLIDPDDCP
jgi:hypothetical protein